MTENIIAKEVAENMHYDEEVAEAYLELGITASDNAKDIAEEIEEAYNGKYGSDEEFVQDLLEQTGDIPRDLPSYVYIDWERTARDIMLDYSEENGHYFRNL